MNPWDLRSALLARHAQHVVLIHLPIALCLTGVIFDVAAAWTRRAEFSAVAYWNLTVAALAAIPSALTGLLAWQFELEGRTLKGILLLHLLLGCTSVLVIIAVWYTHFRQRQRGEASASRYRWPLELAGVLVITLTGYLGGILSGVNHP